MTLRGERSLRLGKHRDLAVALERCFTNAPDLVLAQLLAHRFGKIALCHQRSSHVLALCLAIDNDEAFLAIDDLVEPNPMHTQQADKAVTENESGSSCDRR